MGTAPHPPAEDIAALLAQFRRLPPAARAQAQRLLEGDDPQLARDHFLPFVRAVWPAFVYGRHHRIMAMSLSGLRARAEARHHQLATAAY